jgi:hypothetical protein
MSDEGDEPDFDSVFGECYWILCGQFGSSRAERLKFAIIAIGVGTAILTLTAATTAILVSLENWPVALFLLTLGAGVLIFSWFVGLNRFDELILSDG